jgi:hypothetical protein
MIISVSPFVLPIDDDTQRRPNSVSQAGPLRVEKPTSRMSALGAQSGRLQKQPLSQVPMALQKSKSNDVENLAKVDL